MIRSSCYCLGLATLWVLTTESSLTAQPSKPPTPETKPAEPKAPDSKPLPAPQAPKEKPPPKDLNSLSLPANAVVVICRTVEEGLGLVPQGVVLSADKYQTLLKRIDQLQRQLRAARPDPPSVCKLTGEVKGDLAHLEAHFEFRTEEPQALIALGSQRAWARGATLDGQLPVLLPGGEDGLVVQVDKPGTHQLTLEMDVPVTVRNVPGNERGFDFGLPRAAITTLERLALPAQAAAVKVNGQPLKIGPADAQHPQGEAQTLGSTDHLEVSWKEPVPPAPPEQALLAAEAQINVQVDHARITIDAELTLQVLRGEVKQWQIQVPSQVIPEVKSPLVDHLELPTPEKPILTIVLKGPSTEPLPVLLQLRQAQPGAPAPVGPFTVLGASRQQGTIVVSAPADLRLRYTVHGDVTQREIPEDRRSGTGVAAFTYWNLPAPANQAQLGQAPLDLEVEVLKGSIETRVAQELHLEANLSWRVNTKIDVMPIRTDVDHLEIELPPDYVYDDEVGISPGEWVENPIEITRDMTTRRQLAHLKLTQKQRGPFSVAFAGRFAPPSHIEATNPDPEDPGNSDSRPLALRAGLQSASLELPHPVQTLDRGGQVTVVLLESLDFVVRDHDSETPPAGARNHSWTLERASDVVRFSWQAPETVVTTEVEGTLGPFQARLRFHLHYQFSEPPAGEVLLKVPAFLRREDILQGGELKTRGIVKLTGPISKDQRLEIDYVAPLPAWPETKIANQGGPLPKRRQFSLPLVRPEQATRVDTKIRIWSEPGVRPLLAGAGSNFDTNGIWKELPVEDGPRAQDSLPALVLRSTRRQAPLALELAELEVAPLPRVVVDRALIQVMVDPSGQQTYRARFLVSRLKTKSLEVELAAPVADLNPSVFLNSDKITQLKTVNGGNVLHLDVEPELYRQPLILDLRYQAGPTLPGNWLFRTTLYPPQLKGDVFLNRVRWQVDVPSGWINLYQGGGYTSEQRWEWQGGLLAPHSAVTGAELERWLMAPADSPEGAAGPDLADPSLVCWRTDLEPVHLFHLPQQAWLLLCSLIFLGLGLGLSFAPLSRRWLWTAGGALALATMMAAVWWPAALPSVIYGCEPAAVVLIMVLLFQWLLHRRYRHQVVFLPGFSRLKQGSSLVRGNRGGPAREPTLAETTAPSPASKPDPKIDTSRHRIEGTRPKVDGN